MNEQRFKAMFGTAVNVTTLFGAGVVAANLSAALTLTYGLALVAVGLLLLFVAAAFIAGREYGREES